MEIYNSIVFCEVQFRFGDQSFLIKKNEKKS